MTDNPVTTRPNREPARLTRPAGPAVEIGSATLQFGEDGPGVFDIDLKIPSGSIVALVGPSGSGKSTVLRLILGLERATSGSVRTLGTDMAAPDRATQSRLGYAPQRFVLYPALTLEENLSFVAAIYGLGPRSRRQPIAGLLDRLDLNEARGRPARDLSGGQRRRLTLAAALLHSPEILLADEPTAELDPILRQKVWDLLRDVRAGGATVVLATQRLHEADICDLVAVMRAGRVIAYETPATLRESAFGARSEEKNFDQVLLELLSQSERGS